MVSLKDIKMPFGRGSAAQNVRVLFLVTVFVAQTCGLQFFSIYLKHLNFSAFKVGIIRASQTWISMLLLPAWLLIAKRIQTLSWKRFVIFMFLVVNITVHICLAFLPPLSITQDVTHCLTLQNKLTINEKFAPPRVNTEGYQDVSTEETPSSMSDRGKIYRSLDAFPLKANTVLAHNTPIHKTRHFTAHSAQSEPWKAYSNENIHKRKHSNERYIPFKSERNKEHDIKFREKWGSKHADIPSVQQKNGRRYAQGSNFSGSHAISDYFKRKRNPRDSFSDKEPTNRLQADIVAGMGDPIDRFQESGSKTNISSKPDEVTSWRKQNLPRPPKRHKSGRNMQHAGHKENYSPITGKENNLLAVRRIHKNTKKDKEFDPQKRGLRRKHTSRSEASESQKGEKFSRNVIQKLTTEQPVRHTTTHSDKNNKVHKNHVTPQHLSLSNTLNYNEKEETNNALSMQGPMIADLSESEHYDNHTGFRVDKNTYMKLWNVVAIHESADFFSTTFITILPLAILACVFYRAIATTSYQFLLCEKTLDTSSNMPLTSPYQHVLTLVGWGVFGCPILAGLVLVTQCPYQPRVFLLFSAVLFILNLLMLILLQLPDKCWNLKKLSSEYEEKKGHVSFLQR
jgi:hypothetical protein